MLETMMVSSGSVMYVMRQSGTWVLGKDRNRDDLVQIDKMRLEICRKLR